MIISSDKWNEKYYYEKLPNGLEIYLLEKNNYSKVYGALAVNYGSLDNSFIPPFKTEFIDVPLGVAHFLEHQMFESCEDISSHFARLGAECNAFTSFDRTVYTFTTKENVLTCTELLLDFVQLPSFTNESIEEEKDIIVQELLMYENIPNSKLYNESLKSMYRNCNVRYDICGTIDSIKLINKDILDACYDTFYHPSNMCLILVGNFDTNEIIEKIKDNQNNKTFREFVVIKRRYPEELMSVNKKKSTIYCELQIPKITISLKLPVTKESSINHLMKDLALAVLIDYNFDETSLFYEKLMNDGIINNSYSYESQVDDGFSYFMISCDTHKYQDFETEVKDKMLNLNTISEDDFQRYKNTIIASNLRKMNSLDYYMNLLIDACFCNINLFEIIDAVDNLTVNDVNKMIEHFKEEYITTVILKDEERQ